MGHSGRLELAAFVLGLTVGVGVGGISLAVHWRLFYGIEYFMFAFVIGLVIAFWREQCGRTRDQDVHSSE